MRLPKLEAAKAYVALVMQILTVIQVVVSPNTTASHVLTAILVAASALGVYATPNREVTNAGTIGTSGTVPK